MINDQSGNRWRRVVRLRDHPGGRLKNRIWAMLMIQGEENLNIRFPYQSFHQQVLQALFPPKLVRENCLQFLEAVKNDFWHEPATLFRFLRRLKKGDLTKALAEVVKTPPSPHPWFNLQIFSSGFHSTGRQQS